jgi:hypothetical protein
MMAAPVSELRLDSLTKADDTLLQLNRKFAAYMKSIFPFQYEGKVYQLINNYVAARSFQMVQKLQKKARKRHKKQKIR